MKIAAALLLVAACSSAPAEPSGVANWDVTKTKLKDATGRCEPDDLPDGRKGTWCYMQPPLSIGGQNAQVDLYFGGVDPEAALIELQLKVNACEPEKLDAWARTAFGQPAEHAPGGRTYWQNRYAYVLLIPNGGACMVRVLPLSEQKEVERIKKAS